MAVEPGTAQWAFDHAQPAGMGTDTLPASPLFYLPLVAPMRTRGVLALAPAQPSAGILAPEQRQQLDTFATVTAIALERVHYIEVAQGALVDMESERLRNSLLAALGARPAHAADAAGRPVGIAGRIRAAAVGAATEPGRDAQERSACA
jgi:two-component system sensor histidine kinase KdpD